MGVFMNLFEEQYRKDLIEIEEKINTCKDNKILLNQLNEDKKYIISCLNQEQSKVKKMNLDLKLTDNEDEIKDLVNSNQIHLSYITNISFVNKNDKEIEKLFNNFLEEDLFGLKKVYDEIVSNKGLIFVKDNIRLKREMIDFHY